MRNNAEFLRTVCAESKSEFSFVNEDANFVSISTPFIDNNFDKIEVFASFHNDEVIELSDLGMTFFNLQTSGLNIDGRSKKLHNVINIIAQDFGISMKNYNNSNSIYLKTNISNFAADKFRLIQAIDKLYDLMFLNRPKNDNPKFNDVISAIFSKSNISFVTDHKIDVPNEDPIKFDFYVSMENKGKYNQFIRTASFANGSDFTKVFNYDVKTSSELLPDAQFSLLIDDENNKPNKNVISTALKGLGNNASVHSFSEIKRNPRLILQ